MSVKKFLFALMGVGLCGIGFAGREAIHLEQPRIWYAFDNQANGCTVSGGSANLAFSYTTQPNWGTHDDAAGGYIYGNSKDCPHGGSGLPLADGDWTILARAKVSSTANSIVHCAGAITAGNYGLVMYSGGSDTVKFSILNSFTNFVSTLSVAVPNATTAWHDYACVFTLADRLVTVYVDGVAKGTVNFTNFARTNTAWQWFSIYGGLGASGLILGDTATMLDDYRVYTRALTVADLTALHEGRTQVPVYGGFLTANDATIWRNTQVKDIVRLRLRHGGQSINKDWSVPFYLTRTSTNLLAQMQQVTDAVYNKVTKLALVQTNTTDVAGKILYARYIQPSNYSLYGTQGNDFDVQPDTAGTIAVGNQTGGYGLFQLTADLLTDDNAAVWADDAWATAAPVAGQAVSFRSGSGTWSNTLPAGTAFGRLAFGADSGSITVAGNAGSFSEVVNAGTTAQAITMPLTYTGDFAPETWGPLAFTDLSVAGTFQPVGTGTITFHGTTTLGVADVRYNVRTTDWDPTCPGTVSTWNNNKGYAAASKQPTYSLTTAPGGLTTIGRLQGSWCGQRRQTLYLDGNFSIGGDFQPGNDGVLVITNGTTTFTAGYTVNATYGTNPCLVIAPDGTLAFPKLSAPQAILIYNSGTVNAGNAQGSTSSNIKLHRAGTFNASRMSGTFYTMGQTIGAENGALAITGPIYFSSVETASTGVTFRTSSPAGAAAHIEMTGTLTPYAVPLTITGGGSFAYQTGGALTFAALSVGENTTADFRSCSSVTLTNTTLAAGAKLMLPAWNGGTSPFVNKPTLPTDGQATIALEAASDLVAGTYTLAAAGFTADDLEHLTLKLTGTAASSFTVTCAVTDAGALTATVASAQSGVYRAVLSCTGYSGTETLENFPVLIKLPDAVTGFAYSQVAANGADLWFADASGNRIPHEIEKWDTSGESFVWVRVPALQQNTTFTMTWGGGTSSVPTLSDTATFDSRFLGVWHFNSVGSTTADSSPNKLVMTATGTTANLSGATGPIGTSYFSKGSAYYQTPNASSWLAYTSTKKLTISGWIKTTSTTANQRIVSCKSTWSTAGGFEITTRGSAATELLAGGSNKSQYTKTGITNYKNNWVHFAVIYDGTQSTPVSRMYINGAYVTQATGADYNPQTKSDPLALGAAPGGGSPYSGGMDEIRLAKVVESADWIKAAYDTQATPTTFVTMQSFACESPYDFRALTEANTVDEDTGAYTVYAGVATTLTTPGTGTLVIESGKKAIVPGWDGTIANSGWLTLTRGSLETTAPTSGTTEYAADHVLTFSNPTKPIVCSGNVLITAEFGAFSYIEAPLTITDGVTTLAASGGIVRFGEQNSLSNGTFGARLIMTGGRLQAQQTTLDYSGYWGDNARETSITMSGDSVFTVPIRAWQNTATTDYTKATVDVSGTANFAPEYFGWRNSATLTNVGRLLVTLSENGRFTAPADGIATYVRLTVGEGTPHLTAAANSAAENRGVITLPADGTLTIDGDNATIVNAGTIQGTGTLVVDAGGILDLTDDAGVTTNFTGSLTVKNGGILILPADQVPTYKISLEAGARVIATVSETPSNTAKFLGALASTPSTGTATIEFDLPQSIPLNAVYTLSTSELAAGAADSLAIAFTGAAGETTEGTITLDDTGAVKVTVTASAAKGALLWTGAGQVTTDTGVLTWTLKDSDDATVYPFAGNLPIWFTDAASARTVTVADTVKPSTVTFNTAETYDLRGSAKIDAETVVKDGTGTLVVNGQGFTAPANVTVKAGTLKLGDAAVKNALGTKDTTVTVESGATLDLNTNLPSAGDTARGAATSDNLIIITGDGVDGKGAIWDSNPYADMWHYQLGRVRLSADASIRGLGRIDIRKASTSTFAGRASLTGGDDVTLTAGVQVAEGVNCGFNLNAVDVSIGKIVVDTDGDLGIEGDTTFTVPHGIELKSGARIQYWNAAGKKAPVVVTGTGAGLKASSNDSNTQDAPVTVQDGASLDLRGDKTLTYSSAFANAGEVSVSAGTHVMNAAVTNTGSFKQTGGTLTLNATNYAGVLTMNQTGGTCNLGGDISALPVALTMTGGALWWGINATYPTIGESNVDVSGITGGTLYFSASGNATIPQAFAQAKPKDVYVYNATESQVTTLPAGDFALSGTLHIGKPALPGAVKLSDGTSLTAGTLYLGDEASAPKASLFEVGPGASANFTATGHSQIGRWSGASTAKHEVRVTGGSLAFTDTLALGYDAMYAYLTLTDGLISTPGLAIRERMNAVPVDERFTMTGGTFEIGSYNLWTARRRYEGVHADLQAGTFKARANTSVSTYGMLVATGATMGSEGEGLTIDLNGKTMTQTYIPHFGASAVTLTGAGTYTTSAEWQGIVAGKWTVDTDTSANVDLSGFAGFAGGLELKPNTTAKIAIAGDGTVEYGYIPGSFDNGYTHVSTNGPLPTVVSNLKRIHTQYNSGSPANQGAFVLRGQFYVPEDDAGTWTFAGNFDDNIGLWIDGTQVFKSASYTSVGRGETTLTAGWHDFIVVTYDGTGGQGPCQGNWTGKKALGWRKGSSTSTEANDYLIFDTSTLAMRTKPPVKADSEVTTYRIANSNYGDYSKLKAIADTAWGTPYASGTTLQAALNTVTEGFQKSSAQKYVGGFLVDAAHEGEWTFYASWDDRLILMIDGEEVLHNTNWDVLATAKTTLNVGWHTFEIRTADGSGGYGPDAKGINSGYALAVMRPGDTEKQPFDERTVRVTMQALEAQKVMPAGLDGTTTLGAGSTLVNGGAWSHLTDADKAGRFCPIRGTLEGTGTLSGPYRFVGTNNVWAVTANQRAVTGKVEFNNADTQTLAGLATIRIDFTVRPAATKYLVGPALGLTAAAAEAITVKAPITDALRTSKDGDDTDFEFSATVREGNLYLINGSPLNGTVIFVR